jgi:Holliday junction resolvase RusA-like endonuclease
MKVVLYVAPVPASRPRVTRWSTFFPKKYTQFKKDMEMALTNTTFIPTTKLIYAQLDFFVGMPKSWSKKKKLAKNGKFCDNNADIDNYIKAVLDSLEGVYYENDKQIVMVRARKYYSETPRIEYTQEELEEDSST